MQGQVEMDRSTLFSILLHVGLHSTRSTHVPMLTKNYHQLRRCWAVDQWKWNCWLDESRFVSDHAYDRIRIRRLPSERLLSQCTAGYIQLGSNGIIFWWTYCWVSLGPVVVEPTLKATEYLNIIADQSHPYMTSVFRNGSRMFQQDNAPCHRARSVLVCF